MARAIKRFFKIVLRFEYPRSIFDLSGGELRYTPSKYDYPSTEDSWRQDWENIGGDFRRAATRLQSELV